MDTYWVPQGILLGNDWFDCLMLLLDSNPEENLNKSLARPVFHDEISSIFEI